MALKIPRITNPHVAFVCLTIFALIYGSLGTYLPSQLTTLEKRFDLSATQLGALMSANDCSYLMCIIFVAYFGTHYFQDSVLLASAAFFNTLSALVYLLPFFIFGSRYSKEMLMRSTTISKSVDSLLDTACNVGNYSSNFTTADSTKGMVDSISQTEKWVSFFFQMLAGLLNGFASTPFWTVGVSFIDDIFGKKSGIYLGILFSTRAFAPIIGFSVGSQTTKIHETLRLKAHEYAGGERDPMWIGAWWLGLIAFGIPMICTVPMMYMFDKKKLMENAKKRDLDKQRESELKNMVKNCNNINAEHTAAEVETLNDKDHAIDDEVKIEQVDEKRTIKAMLKMYVQLWTNKVYATLIGGLILEIFGMITLMTFFTKYLEFRFRVPASSANLMTAFSMAGSRIIAGFASGLVSKFIAMNTKQKLRYHAIVNIVACVLFAALFFVPCPFTQIYGLSSNAINCTSGCQCPLAFKPVCSEGKTYFSACHAGCRSTLNNSYFGDCLCGLNATAKATRCEQRCNSVFIYLVLFFVINVIGSLGSVQFTEIIMKQGDPKHKASRLAMLGFCIAIMGIILPLIAGKTLDKACLIGFPTKLGSSFCILYDTDKAHYLMNGICFAMQIPACILFTLAYFVYKSKNDETEVVTKHTIWLEN